MSMSKRWLEEQESRRFKSGNRSLICSAHFSDYALKSFIETTGRSGMCEYCDEQIDNTQVITFDALMEIVTDGIYNHFGNPDYEGVPYSSEYGYWEKTFDTDELIRWVIGLEAEDNIVQEIIDSIGFDNVWCRTKPDMPSQSEFLSFDWNIFTKILKHEARYVFYKYPKKIKDEYYRKIEPASILDKIGRAIIGLQLFHKTSDGLFNNLKLYRARQHKRSDKVSKCKHIGL